LKKNILVIIVFMVWLAINITQLFTLGLITRFLPLIAPQEDLFAQQYISLLKTGDIAQAEAYLDSGIASNGRKTLPAMRDYLNSLGDTVSMHLLRVSYIKPEKSQSQARQLSYYADFPKGSLLIEMVLLKNENSFVVNTFQFHLLNESFEQATHFSFWGKSWFHYVFLFIAVLLPIFTFYTLIGCLNSPVRRKWLWIPFIAAGLGRFSLIWNDLSWHDAVFQTKLMGLQVFSGGILKESIFQPWILCVSLPLGAIVFYFRHVNGKPKQPVHF